MIGTIPTRRRTAAARMGAVLLAASLAVVAAAQQPTTPPDNSQAPAPIERSAPDAPPMAPAPPHRSHHATSMRDRDHGMSHGMEGFGDHMMGMGWHGMWWHNPELAQRLALTPEQTSRMDEIVQKSRLQLVDLKANLDRQNLLLEPIMNANPVDQARAMAQIDKVAEARADLEKANAKMLLGIRGVLSPEQWTRLRSRGNHGPKDSDQGGPMDGRSGGPGGMHGSHSAAPADEVP